MIYTKEFYNFDTKRGLIAYVQSKDGRYYAVCYIFKETSLEDFKIYNYPPRKVTEVTNIEEIFDADSDATIEERCRKMICDKKGQHVVEF